MKGILANVLRFIALVLAFLPAVALSNWPIHRTIPEGSGLLTLSFSYAAERRATCRDLSAQEMAELPANMRRRQVCPRERPSLELRLEADGRLLFAAVLAPSGIAGDGPSRVHESFVLPAGSHSIAVRMRYHPGPEEQAGGAAAPASDDAFDWSAAEMIELPPAGHRVIDFRPESGGFVFSEGKPDDPN